MPGLAVERPGRLHFFSNSNQKLLPLPGLLSTSNAALWANKISVEIASPTILWPFQGQRRLLASGSHSEKGGLSSSAAIAAAKRS